jgi:hypothetical protein
MKLRVWRGDIKYAKDWMGKRVWSDVLDWIASGRSTPD